ncbi:hypothetical protein PoB_006665800 [Plakobranchus ocellatus]|uniref:Uncharacterized protein n=1 Tax=Plakobranchus ocellatus TaxID=259542 RepID=A0AAV4D7F6_9GAST|nr:hypothetical protein PoB_006665800 [Plakobranchus ocellatus]
MRGRQKKHWEDDIREWIGLELRNTLRKAEDREEWKAVGRRSSAAPRRIPNPRDRSRPATSPDSQFWHFALTRTETLYSDSNPVLSFLHSLKKRRFQ